MPREGWLLLLPRGHCHPHHEVCRSTWDCLCWEPSSSSAVNCLAPAQGTETPPQDRHGPQLASRASRVPAPSCLLYQQLAPWQPLGRPSLASAMPCCPCHWQGRPCCPITSRPSRNPTRPECPALRIHPAGTATRPAHCPKVAVGAQVSRLRGEAKEVTRTLCPWSPQDVLMTCWQDV